MAIDTSVHAELQRKAKDHLWLHFSSMGDYRDREIPIIERGEGPYLFDTHGKRYLDMLSGLFTVQIGYSYGEELGQAALEQMRAAAVLHELDVRAPAGRRARGAGSPSSHRRASTARSSSPAAPRPSSRPGSWRASTTPPTASRCGARSSRARSPTTARPWARSRSPASRRSARRSSRSWTACATSRTRTATAASTAPRPGDCTLRVRRRGRRDDRAGGARDGRHGDHGARAELRRHVHAAPAVPPPRARDLRRLRRPAGRRRGHLRLRPPRRVVRLPALRLRARPDHVRQGAHERVRARSARC